MSGTKGEVKDEAGTCAPGCNCGASGGSGKRGKWLVFGGVVLVAVGVTAARISGAKAAATAPGYAMPAVAAGAPAPVATAADDVWGAPLKEMAELNVVATNTEAVFVVIPSEDVARTEAIQKEVAAAAVIITGRGTKTGLFLLSRDAGDYKDVVAQAGAPAVLAMVKGKGMSVVVDKEVTKDALLKAFVGASRPSSGCGPAGCGPSASGCN